MGRLSKYKKVKSSVKTRGGVNVEFEWGTNSNRKPKKRSITATKFQKIKLKRRGGDNGTNGFDLPLEKDDFDMNDLTGSLKKEKGLVDILQNNNNSSAIGVPKPPNGVEETSNLGEPTAVVNNEAYIGGKHVSCSIPSTTKEERKIARLLNIDVKSGETMTKGTSSHDKKLEGRREGESMNAFSKRLKEETKLALQNDLQKGGFANANPNKRLRKKDFLKNKKMKKKGQMQVEVTDERDSRDDEIITEEVHHVGLPEQVTAPPVFKHLPRGAHKILKTERKKVGELGGDRQRTSMDAKKISSEQIAMEAIRKNVQARYAVLKEKRMKEFEASRFRN